VNIALFGQFASWAGALLGLDSRPVLIAESEEAVAEARMRLARIGLENARGYLKGGVEAWKRAGLPLEALRQISVEDLSQRLRGEEIQVLDVRREREWEDGHIEGASWWPLDNFKVSPPEIDRNIPIAVHCKGGYRSLIACSLLQRAGFQKVVNVVGGFDAWQGAGLAVAAEKVVEA
jgi:rhodanese-related sulfurtransferase